MFISKGLSVAPITGHTYTQLLLRRLLEVEVVVEVDVRVVEVLEVELEVLGMVEWRFKW